MPPCMPVLVNTAAAAEMVIPLAKAGLDCLLMIHEMPDYIRDQSLMPHLRAAHAAGAGLVASMVSDDNFLKLFRAELVEYRLPD